MRKTFFVLAIISCFLFASVLKNYKISVKGSPREISVPDDYPKIQLAINNANEGDIVFVHNGTYYENVVINKRITLIGENYEFTIIDSKGTNNVITVEANNVTIKGFTLNNSGYQTCGILLNPLSMNNVITNNLILNSYYGISIASSNNNVINNNSILNSYYGISIASSSSNIIGNNTISNNSFGVYLHFSSGNLISENNINNNVYFGIHLFSSTDNLFSYNILSHNNMTGITLFSNSTKNVFYGNNIYNNLLYGISLYSSPSNLFYGNNIINNKDYGIYSLSSGNNIFYHNNFNNTRQVSSDSTNIWSWDSEGNYWSDYTGRDLNKDGIGDTPYVKDSTVQDAHPLAGMFYDFIVSLGKKTYHVNIISNSTISNFTLEIDVETRNKIMSFNVTREEGTFGFCRIAIPTELMNYSYIILIGQEEIVPTFLGISNQTLVYLYFVYPHKNQAIIIVSSEILRLYEELLASYSQLQTELYNLLNNYTQLQRSFEQLNASFQYFYDLNVTFHNFLGDYAKLQEDFRRLNSTYYVLTDLYGQLQMNFGNLNLTYQNLLNALVLLSGNYTQLQEDYQELNASYQDYLRSYSEGVNNIRSLTYVIAALTAILIIVTTYLSKRAYCSSRAKINRFEEE